MTPTDQPELWQLTEQQLLDEVGSVSTRMLQLEARRVALVGEIDDRVGPETLGFSNPKNWLLATTLLEPSETARIFALARGLRKFPDIADAFDAGKISIRHAAMILDFAENPPQNLPDDAADIARKALLDAATGPGANTSRIRGAITHLNDNYGSDTPPAEDTDRNELFASITTNGRLAVKGSFDAVNGEKFLTALSPLSAPTPAADGTRDPRTPAKRRADAFGHLIDHYLATKDRPTEGGDRPHLNLHIRAEHLADVPQQHHCAQGVDADQPDDTSDTDIIDDESTRAHDTKDKVPQSDRTAEPDRGVYTDLFGDGSAVGWLPWMGPLTRATSRQLTCDCVLTPIILDEHANPINLGRTVRTVTAKQKRALIARDHGCAFPGCGKPASWTEAHHIVHWINGGPTDLDNLVLLCAFHHQLLHHSDWQVLIGSDGHPWFRPPSTVDPTRQLRPSHARAGPRIA